MFNRGFGNWTDYRKQFGLKPEDEIDLHYGKRDSSEMSYDEAMEEIAELVEKTLRRAQEKGRDFSADWVHLKLNDQAQRTVLCKDPFKSHDERVEKLIASM